MTANIPKERGRATNVMLKIEKEQGLQTLGGRLAYAMRKSGIKSQSELARRTGLSQSVISCILYGQVKQSKNIWTLSEALVVTPTWLVTGEGPILKADEPLIPSGQEQNVVRVWDASGMTADEIMWPEKLPSEFRAYNIKSDTGFSEVPAGSIIIINPVETPVNNDLILLKNGSSLNVYRALVADTLYLSLNNSPIPPFKVPDTSEVLGVVVQTFIRDHRK